MTHDIILFLAGGITCTALYIVVSVLWQWLRPLPMPDLPRGATPRGQERPTVSRSSIRAN